MISLYYKLVVGVSCAHLGFGIFPSRNYEFKNQSWKYHKGTFIWIKTNYIFSAFLKTKSKFHQMTFHITIDREIILKYLRELQVLSKSSIDYTLEIWLPILNTKWHHHPYKSSPIYYKGYFVLIFGAIEIWWYLEYPSKNE